LVTSFDALSQIEDTMKHIYIKDLNELWHQIKQCTQASEGTKLQKFQVILYPLNTFTLLNPCFIFTFFNILFMYLKFQFRLDIVVI